MHSAIFKGWQGIKGIATNYLVHTVNSAEAEKLCLEIHTEIFMGKVIPWV